MSMERRCLGRLAAVSLVAAGWLVLLTAQLPAQQAPDPLRAALAKSGARHLRALRFTAFGARYSGGAASVRVPLPRYEGGLDTTPHGFLRAAAANRAAVRAVPLGVELSFVSGGQRVAGVLNEQFLVDRVRTWVSDPGGDRVIDTYFRDYRRLGRVMFPMHITQDHGPRPALDLWVTAIEAHHDKETW
jgi:hypothetical protein